jgi:hypothetical protein
MEMRLRVNTLLLLNLNAFFLKKVLYYMKVIIIWDIFAEFGKKIARKIQSYKEGEIYKKLLIKIHLIAYYDDHKKNIPIVNFV